MMRVKMPAISIGVPAPAVAKVMIPPVIIMVLIMTIMTIGNHDDPSCNYQISFTQSKYFKPKFTP